jgi:peptidoglycan/xylan/chitin deacetylase (PgdA/CDA1 family)
MHLVTRHLKLPALLVLALLGALVAAPADAATKPQKPAPPTGLHATSISATSIGLAWTGSSGATGYMVYRGGKSPIAVVGDTSWADTTVAAGKTYSYTVSAYNSVGESGRTAPLTVTAQSPPPAPTGLAAGTVSSGSVALSWDAATGASGYRVYRDGAATPLVEQAGTSWTDTTVAASTGYSYTVTAFNAAGESAPSAPLAVTTPDAPPPPPVVPSAPTGLAAGEVSSGSVALSWGATAGADGYRVYRDGAATPLVEQAGTSWTDTTVAASTGYSYTVTAFNAAGESAPSAPLAVTTPAPPTRTVVSLTFDDGLAEQYAARSVLAAHGMHGTFFVNSGRIDTTSAYLTLAQLRDLAADGNEIAGHTVQHADLTALSTDEATREVCNDRTNLLSWGFQPTSFAYPYGHYNAAVERIVAGCGYNSAREVGDVRTPADGGCAGCAYAETIPPADPYATRAPDSVDGTWSLADIEHLVTQAEDHGGGWVQLTFHHIADGGGAYSVTPANFTALLDWLQARAGNGTVVKTVQDLVGGSLQAGVAGPVPPVGQPLQNASLEADGNGDNLPDCWSFGTFGSNTASWTRTSDAHSGAWAERVDVSAYTSGDRKLVMTQDLGECTPTVTPGHRQALSAWYKGSSPTQLVVYYRDQVGKWFYWASSPSFAAAGAWTKASWTTPAVPSGATALSFGLNLAAVGSLTTDDYALADAGVAPPPVQTALGDNASLETDGNGDNLPDCWQFGASGSNTATWTRTGDAHSGSFAERVDITAFTSGDRKLVTKQDTGTCSPVVTPGHTYQLSTWYKAGPARFVVYYRDGVGVWHYWTQSPLQASQADWAQASWTTPAVPADATALSFGLNLAQAGTLLTDDYALADTTQGQQQAPATGGGGA